jgi:hypothetical protein
LVKIGTKFCELEDAVEKAEEDHQVTIEKAAEEHRKIERLRKQKKLWLEKMICTVRRGILSVKELEKIEKEETE